MYGSYVHCSTVPMRRYVLSVSITDSIQQHTNIPLISDSKIDVTTDAVEVAGEIDIDMYRLHGELQSLFQPARSCFDLPVFYQWRHATYACLHVSAGVLMITAWMLLISISLILARFYKPAFPGKTVCGVQIWFAVR